MGEPEPLFFADTSYLIAREQEQAWTYAIRFEKKKIDGLETIVLGEAFREHINLEGKTDEYGMPRATRPVGIKRRRGDLPGPGAALFREIRSMYNQKKREIRNAEPPTPTDRNIIGYAVENARRGNPIYVATGDGAIITVLEAFRDEQGLDITVWKPQPISPEAMQWGQVTFLTTGDALSQLPAAMTETKNYYLRILESVYFRGGYIAPVIVEVLQTSALQRPPAAEPGTQLMRLLTSPRERTFDAVHRIASKKMQGMQPTDQFAIFDSQEQNGLTIYEFTHDSEGYEYGEHRWARVDGPYLSRHHTSAYLHLQRNADMIGPRRRAASGGK